MGTRLGISEEVQQMLDESYRREAWRRESLRIDLWMGFIISGLCVLGIVVNHL